MKNGNFSFSFSYNTRRDTVTGCCFNPQARYNTPPLSGSTGKEAVSQHQSFTGATAFAIKAMDTSIQNNSDPAQLIEKLNQLYKKHMETPRPSLSQTQRREQNKTGKKLAQCKAGPRRVQPSRKHDQTLLQKKLDNISRKEQQHPWHKEHRAILMAYCRPELAEFIPPEILVLLQELLSSEYSVLKKPSYRLLIKILDNPEELKKVIQNNPELANGRLVNMDKAVFKRESQITKSAMDDKKKNLSPSASCDYSGISFRQAVFPCMTVEATFKNCNFFQASFTGSGISHCDFYGADLTAAYLAECSITNCDFSSATLTDVNFGGVESILYYPKKDRCFSETITLLSSAILHYSSNHGDALPLRSLAYMLLENTRLKEAEAVYDELVRRRQTELIDFLRLGLKYLDMIRELVTKNVNIKHSWPGKPLPGCKKAGERPAITKGRNIITTDSSSWP